MSEPRTAVTAARLGIEVPDLPRWVEAHGLAADARSWVEGWPDGAMIGNAEAALAVICGRVETARIERLAETHAEYHLLCAPEHDLELPLRHRQRALLATATEPLDDPGELVSLLAPEDSLDHVPAALRRELVAALPRHRIWAAWVEGAPVSFAHAPWRSDAWFDVSVDTLPRFRQLGLGGLVARALIAGERAAGRAPVWGATEDNLASLRLAQGLGFSVVDALWVYSPRGAP